jgi:hypothetical protein
MFCRLDHVELWSRIVSTLPLRFFKPSCSEFTFNCPWLAVTVRYGALALFSVILLRSDLSVTPGKEFIQPCDLCDRPVNALYRGDRFAGYAAIEPGISVRVNPAGIVLEMFSWLFALSVTRLIARLGPDQGLPDLAVKLSADCPRSLAGLAYDRCQIYFPNLAGGG